MIALRPIAYVVGRVLIVLAILMLGPAALDWRAGDPNAMDFLEAAIITGGTGLAVSFATANALARGLNLRQAWAMTVAIWGLAPVFGALPFVMGAPHLPFTQAYFEAVSGITTTGSTVIVGLDHLPDGTNLWRGLLNFIGGLGIAFVAMIFLPVMRVGGMQFFRTEGFDTFGKALPRATDIARQLVIVYFGLAVICGITYRILGMSPLDAVICAMSTIATGGFAPMDISFQKYPGAIEYAAAAFMLAASLPYIRYVQLLNNQPRPLWHDPQARAYLRWTGYGVASVTLWRVATSDQGLESSFREALFNLVSIQSSTGFFSGSFASWGGYALVVSFVVGVIGACSGSSAAGLSVFRVQVAAAALSAQLRQIASPSRVVKVKYDGRVVGDDVISGLILFITGYVFLLGLLTVVMTLFGVDVISALWGVWTAIGNVGFGFGPLVARTGTFIDYPDAAIWIMTLAMLLGRLGLLAVLVMFLPRFWRD